MKGFEINHNGKVISVAIEDGLLMIDLFHVRGNGSLYVGGVDYRKRVKLVWHDNVPINIGDKIDIKFTEIDHISEPVKCTHDEDIKRPFTKLKRLLDLEQYLKSKGLL